MGCWVLNPLANKGKMSHPLYYLFYSLLYLYPVSCVQLYLCHNETLPFQNFFHKLMYSTSISARNFIYKLRAKGTKISSSIFKGWHYPRCPEAENLIRNICSYQKHNVLEEKHSLSSWIMKFRKSLENNVHIEG